MKTKTILAVGVGLFLAASGIARAQGTPPAGPPQARATGDATPAPGPAAATSDATAQPRPPAETSAPAAARQVARPGPRARQPEAAKPRPVSETKARARAGARPPAARTGTPAGGKCPTVAKKAVAKPKPKPKKEGWKPTAKAGLVTSLLYNKNIPGVDDGLTFSLGVVLGAGLAYVKGPHAFEAKLKVVETIAKTPTVSPILKTADELFVSATYRYSMPRFHKLRVFGSAELSAPMFPGDLVPSADTNLLVHRLDGSVETRTAKGDERYDLTDGFSPLVLRQLLGGWITPVEEKTGVLDLRLSVAGEEVVAGGFAVQDDAATTELDLVELQSYQQLGFRLDVGMKGTLKKRLKYELNAVFMFPVYTSVDTDLQGFDLMNADLSFKLGVQLAKWASVDYQFSAKRMPMIVRQWQVVSNLVLTLTANIL